MEKCRRGRRADFKFTVNVGRGPNFSYERSLNGRTWRGWPAEDVGTKLPISEIKTNFLAEFVLRV